MEGPDQVLARRQIDAGLPPDRGIDHTKHCGGDTDEINPAQPTGGHETRHIGGSASSQSNHQIAARETSCG